MMDKIKELMKRYEEIIIYLIVGVLNTIVSWGACWVAEALGLDPNNSAQHFVINTIGWVAGVSFGYVLNRKWVFRSQNPKVLKEFMGFAGSRLSTWFLDIVIMEVLVNAIHMNYWIAKICISSVVVMVLNYVFSKLFVFKKKTPEREKAE